MGNDKVLKHNIFQNVSNLKIHTEKEGAAKRCTEVFFS